jgi:hypothetical protein
VAAPHHRARRKPAEMGEALARLAAGNFRRYEQCRSGLRPGLLTVVREARYCPPCAAGTIRVLR